MYSMKVNSVCSRLVPNDSTDPGRLSLPGSGKAQYRTVKPSEHAELSPRLAVWNWMGLVWTSLYMLVSLTLIPS